MKLQFFPGISDVPKTVQTRLRRLAVIGAAVALTSLGSFQSASAAVYYTDFVSLGYVLNSTGEPPYSDGGITVQYPVGSGHIYSSFQANAPGAYSWDVYQGIGYTDITLTNGGTFTSATLQVATYYASSSSQLNYELLNGSTVVATGDWGSIPGDGSGFTIVTFSGGVFTELRVQDNFDTSFYANGTTENGQNADRLAIGSISLTTAVPELSTWAMMLIGFAGLGFARYSRMAKEPEALPLLG